MWFRGDQVWGVMLRGDVVSRGFIVLTTLRGYTEIELNKIKYIKQTILY